MTITAKIIALAVAGTALLGLGTGTAAATPQLHDMRAFLSTPSGQTLHETFAASAADREIIVTNTTQPGQIQDRVDAVDADGRLWIVNDSDQDLIFTLWTVPSASMASATIDARTAIAVDMRDGSSTPLGTMGRPQTMTPTHGDTAESSSLR